MPCSFQAQYLPPKPQRKGFFQGPLPRWIGRSLMYSRSRNTPTRTRVSKQFGGVARCPHRAVRWFGAI
jgi:hypothetical protein